MNPAKRELKKYEDHLKANILTKIYRKILEDFLTEEEIENKMNEKISYYLDDQNNHDYDNK